MDNYISGFTSYFIFTLFFHKFFITEGSVSKYLKDMKDEKRFFKKVIILVMLLVLSLFSGLITFLFRIDGVLIIVIVIFILLLSFSSDYTSESKCKDKKSILLLLALSIFTPDYRFADIYKPENRVKKYEYIKLMNGINLVTSIILFFIITSFSIFKSKFTIGFISYRCISRSLELIIAFGTDAITPKKRSILSAGDRVKLAINSYIEVVFNYTALYHLLSIVGENIYNKLSSAFSLILIPPFTSNKLYEILDINYNSEISYIIKKDIYIITSSNPPKIESIDPFTSFFKSIGISTFSGIGTSQLGIFSSLHLFTSFVLVVFAIAVYLSNIGEEHKEKETSKLLLLDSKKILLYLIKTNEKELIEKIDNYLESNEYKILDKKTFILNDIKSYKRHLIKNFYHNQYH